MHLVLRRSPGQSIIIGKKGDIKITFHREKDGVAHIGIEAPDFIPVDRLEIRERKMRERANRKNSPDYK